jgi:hypothetical protein
MDNLVFLGHDNSIDLALTQGIAAQDLTAVTQMTITLGGVTITSDNGSADPIRWAKAGYGTGEARLFLGLESIPAGIYPACPLVVYSANNPEGVVWDFVAIEVKAEVENT